MLQIAIIEDELDSEKALHDALMKYAEEKEETIKCQAFPSGEAFLNNYNPIFDIVFMDIGLSGMNGMETAHKLRDIDDDVPLIFITSMAQFAIEGYKVNAVDFIVKPCHYYDLKMRMDRILRNKRSPEDYLTIYANGGKRLLEIQNLLYIESSGHQLIYHSSKGTFSSYSKSMKEIESELSSHGFARCSVFCLVNMNHISAIHGNEISIEKETLTITRGKRKDFIKRFADYSSSNSNGETSNG